MGSAIVALIGGSTLIAMTPAGARDSRGEQLITFPGGAARLWHGPGPHGEATAYYSISSGGLPFSEPRATSYDLKLRHGVFDPLGPLGAPPVARGLEAGPDTNLYIVQFHTQPLEGYRRAIEGLGGDVLAFLPRHSHVLRLDRDSVAQVEALPFVRWVGDFHPVYRMEEWLLEALAGDAEASGHAGSVVTWNVGLWHSDIEVKRTVARRIEAVGGLVLLVDGGKVLVRARMTPAQAGAAARWDEVSFIDRWSPLEPQVDIAREISGANFIEGVEGFAGEGVRGEVLDLGFNLGHLDFQSRPLILHTPVGENRHGASTSGIIFGDGLG
jgi:hypothetical protein